MKPLGARIAKFAILLLWFIAATAPTQGRVLAQNEVYAEDFEDGQAQNWDLEPGWQVIQAEGNYVLSGEGHVWARASGFYDDYHLSFRVKLIKGGVHLIYRLNDSGRYFIGINSGYSQLHKQYWPDTFQDNLARGNKQHNMNQWVQVEIVGAGNTLTLIVDGVTEWTYTDTEPLLEGRFAFETLENSQVYIDDIKVELAPTSVYQGAESDESRTWVRLGGPIGGLGYDIRMRPDDPDVLYVTDAWAGVHKSTDGGRNWFTLNDGIDARTGPSGDAIPVFCLTIDPNDPDIVWIGLQNLGSVYRSEDGGQTWQKRVNGIVEGEGLTLRGITIEPGNSNTVYIAGEISSWKWAGKEFWGLEFDRVRGVVYKSTDGGANWKSIWRGENLARYIWIDPNDHNILYVSTGIFDREAANSEAKTNTAGGEGVLKSTDGGATWTNVNNGLGNLYVGSLFMHPQDPNILLAGTGNNSYPEGGGVYLTTNGGESWSHVAGDHITSVEFALSNPEIAYASGDGTFYRSEDGGRTWKLITGQDGRRWGPAGIRPGFPIDLQVDPRNPDRIFVNNYGGGNFLSEDGGQTWVSSSTGYTGADLRAVTVHPNNPGFVLANGRSGPFLSRDGGATWVGINPTDIKPIAEGARITVDPSNPDHILASSAHWGWTYESTDGGLNWYLATDYYGELQNLPVSNTNEKFQGFQAITFAPSDPRIVYGGFGLWRGAIGVNPNIIVSILLSQDGGHSWTRSSGTSLKGLTVTEIVVHPTKANVAWAATLGGGIFRTEDMGQTWSAVNKGLASKQVMVLAGDPVNPEVLYAGSENQGVYKSENGGESWKPIRAGMDANEPVYALAVDPLHPNVIYAGSNRSGIFLSEDSGAHWQLINDGLRTRAVTSLAISGDGETLYAGTTGEGVFRLSTHDQAFFDSLVPAPTPLPPPPTATSMPDKEASPLPFCTGAVLLPFGLVLFFQRRRKPGK